MKKGLSRFALRVVVLFSVIYVGAIASHGNVSNVIDVTNEIHKSVDESNVIEGNAVEDAMSDYYEGLRK